VFCFDIDHFGHINDKHRPSNWGIVVFLPGVSKHRDHLRVEGYLLLGRGEELFLAPTKVIEKCR
jgi:hypothetical protein